MKVPGWLLRIMVSYLSGRKINVRFKGKISEERHMKAGTGQGCLLGFWCFLFLVNFAGPTRDPKPIGEYVTETINKREPMKAMKRKWVDNLSVLVSVDLKKDAVESPELQEKTTNNISQQDRPQTS